MESQLRIHSASSAHPYQVSTVRSGAVGLYKQATLLFVASYFV